jgi:hypothetical protein
MKLPRIGEVWCLRLFIRPEPRNRHKFTKPRYRTVYKVLGSKWMGHRSRKMPDGEYRDFVGVLFDCVRYNKGRYTALSPTTILKSGKFVLERQPCPTCGLYPVTYRDGSLYCPNDHRTHSQDRLIREAKTRERS